MGFKFTMEELAEPGQGSPFWRGTNFLHKMSQYNILPSITDISFGTKSSLISWQLERNVEFLTILLSRSLMPACTTEHKDISSAVKLTSSDFVANTVHAAIDSTANLVSFLARFSAEDFFAGGFLMLTDVVPVNLETTEKEGEKEKGILGRKKWKEWK